MDLIKKENPVIIVIGKAGSGKTHLIKYILNTLQAKKKTRSRIVVLFSKTKFNKSYDYIPEAWRHSKFKPEVVRSLMSMQASIAERGKKPPKITLLFDDCVQASTFSTELFQDLIFNHRHYRFTIIMSFQYMLKNAPTFLRENYDDAFIFQMTTTNSIKGVKDAFGSSIDDATYEDMRSRLGDHKFIHFTPDSAETLIAPEVVPDPLIRYEKTITIDQLDEL